MVLNLASVHGERLESNPAKYESNQDEAEPNSDHVRIIVKPVRNHHLTVSAPDPLQRTETSKSTNYAETYGME